MCPCNSRSIKPWTEFKGVRSSCETIDTKLARTWLATLTEETSRAEMITCILPSPISTGVTLALTSVLPINNSSLERGCFCCNTRICGQLEVLQSCTWLRLWQHSTSAQLQL